MACPMSRAPIGAGTWDSGWPAGELLLPLLREAGAAQSVGKRAAALFVASRRARGGAARRGTVVALARRGGAGSVATRSDLVVQPQRQCDALARFVHVQHFHSDDVAGLHHLARILDEALC